MPRYSKAVTCTVGVGNFTPLYGFPCRASEPAKGALGIKTFDSSMNTVFGANRPKPPRAKYIGSGTPETSFLDKDTPANGTNVRLVAAGKAPVSPGGKKVYVDFHGLKWVWSLAPDVSAKISNATGYSALGVKEFKDAAQDTCFGCSAVFIKTGNLFVRSPLRAYSENGGNKLSTFVETPFTGTTTWTIE